MIASPSRAICGVLALVAALGFASPLLAEISWRPLGEEFKVNDRTPLDQFRPAVATLADGRSFVIWADAGQLRLYGKLLDAAGQPLTGDLWIDERPPSAVPFNPLFRAKVAAGRDGQFVVAWCTFDGGLMIRRYDATGEPLSIPILVRHEPGERATDPEVVFDAAGNFFLAWTAGPLSSLQPDVILLQKFDAAGKPLAGASRIDQGKTADRGGTRLALDPETGGGIAVWIDLREANNPDVWARRFTSAGQPLASEFLVDVSKSGEALGAVPIFRAGGGFSVVWSNHTVETGIIETVAQGFDAKGARAGSEVVLTEEGTDLHPPAVVPDRRGGALVLWAGVDQRGPDSAVLGRLFDSSWQPASPVFQVNTFVEWDQTEPAVATDGRGNYTAVWSSGERPFPGSPPPVEFRGQDGSSYGVFGQRFSFACAAGPDRLCLSGDRFEVRVEWKNPFNGQTGIGRSHPLTADTGAFWFFGPGNLELMIKVLDARPVNGHFWVYYGSLSNVEYTITVTDTATGGVRTYRNPPFRFASQGDVSAFPEAPSKASVAVRPPARPVFVPKAGVCTPSAQALCLAGGRFAVEVSWTDPRTGVKAQGRAIPLTGDTGVFWFLDAANLELMVKILDARTVNGRFWVLFGALSDLEYTITITDVETGQQRTYHNERGRLASRADLAAFPVPTSR